MAKKELSDMLHDKLKRIYPESHALDIDRGFDAEETLDPTPANIKQWKDNTNRSDIKGFDDKSAKEISITRFKKKVIGIHYIADNEEDGHCEDKFVRHGQVAGELIKNKSDQIRDLYSMKQTIREAWSKDKGLKGLTNELTESDWESLFKHPIIQEYIDQNTSPELIQFVSRRFKVEQVRASRIIRGLNPRQRQVLYTKLKAQKLPRLVIPKRSPTGRRIRWSDQEINFVRQNISLKPERLAEAYNRAFRTRRSYGAVRNKYYQVRRSRKKTRR